MKPILILVESCGTTDTEKTDLHTSRNQGQIAKYVKKTNFLAEFIRFPMIPVTFSPAARLFNIVRLVLSYLSFRTVHGCFMFGISQRTVYMTSYAEPVFLGNNLESVNARWLLHVVNFFRHHITTPSEATLWRAYLDLGDFYKPRPWQGKLPVSTEPRMIGPSWKGSHCE